jgi:hypothetical protein
VLRSVSDYGLRIASLVQPDSFLDLVDNASMPPPSIPSVLQQVLRAPIVTKDDVMARRADGGPAPLAPSVAPSELLSRSRAFNEIMTFSHAWAEPTAASHLSAEEGGSETGVVAQPHLLIHEMNASYARRIDELEQRLERLTIENGYLREQLALKFDFVPPRTFIPADYYDAHRDVIEALNDYHQLFREVRSTAASRVSP